MQEKINVLDLTAAQQTEMLGSDPTPVDPDQYERSNRKRPDPKVKTARKQAKKSRRRNRQN
jgi:hypothetical protein